MDIRKTSMKNAIEYYKQNESATIIDCVRKFDVDRGTLSSHLKKLGLNTRRNKYKFNEDFFEVIDTEEKAYWLGFVLADGSIDDKKKQISIGLAHADEEHLYKFKKALQAENPINFYHAKNNVTEKSYPTNDLALSSRKMINDLNKHYIFSNKTKNEIPIQLEDHLMKHYIRGFYDGDGWISSYKRRPQDRCKNLKWELGIGSGYEIVQFISNHFYDTLKVTYKEATAYSSIYRIRYSNQNDINKILEYLYSDATIYLNRKYQKALEFNAVLGQKSLDTTEDLE